MEKPPPPAGPAQEGLGAAVGTCAQEKHLIAPVGRIHLVHGDGGEPVGGARADHQGPPLQRVHGLVHERVAAHEVDHLVGVVLGGLHGRREGPAWALQAGERIRPRPPGGLPGPTATGEASVRLSVHHLACSLLSAARRLPCASLSAGPAPVEAPGPTVPTPRPPARPLEPGLVATFCRADHSLSTSPHPCPVVSFLWMLLTPPHPALQALPSPPLPCPASEFTSLTSADRMERYCPLHLTPQDQANHLLPPRPSPAGSHTLTSPPPASALNSSLQLPAPEQPPRSSPPGAAATPPTSFVP